jgi:glucan endo-1,3-alpha-glucosidase
MMHFNHPSQFIPLIERWHAHQSYYSHNGHPFVSTFYGARMTFGESTPSNGWQKHYREPLQAKGIWTYFVPAFSDVSSGPNGFTYGYPVIDGVMNWDGAWPYESDGKVDVSSMSDKAYFIDTHTYAKTFMMGTLPLFAIISAERLGVESSAPSLREVHR